MTKNIDFKDFLRKFFMNSSLFSSITRNHQKELSKLLHKKYREETQEFLAEGIRLCQELLASNVETKSLIFTDRLLQHPLGAGLIQQAQEKKISLFQTTEEILAKLSDTEYPQPVVAHAKQRDHSWQPEKFVQFKRLVVLVDISDPGNLGTIFRTSEAFSWDGIICAGNTVDFYNPKVLRSSMGAFFRLPSVCISQDTILSFFEDNEVTPVLTIPREGEQPPFYNLPQKLALCLGNEAHGLPSSFVPKKARYFQLPMASHVESLNVAVAAGIMLFLLKNTK